MHKKSDGQKPESYLPECAARFVHPKFQIITRDLKPKRLREISLGSGQPTGIDFLHYLQECNFLSSCLNLAEGRQLMASGLLESRFNGVHPAFWRSVCALRFE